MLFSLSKINFISSAVSFFEFFIIFMLFYFNIFNIPKTVGSILSLFSSPRSISLSFSISSKKIYRFKLLISSLSILKFLRLLKSSVVLKWELKTSILVRHINQFPCNSFGVLKKSSLDSSNLNSEASCDFVNVWSANVLYF